jgi:hyperosmotically inducible protein
VKSSLAADPDFTALKIDVHADDGVVTLIGRAPDPAARERASQIARNVREVRSVENQLTLG